MLNQTDSGAPQPEMTCAYSWEQVGPPLGNIIPFYWLKLSDLDNLRAAVVQAMAATDSMPEGQRVLFSWDLHREISRHPLDVLRDAHGDIAGYTNRKGLFVPYHGIWWDHGVKAVADLMDNFFKRYAAVGGQLDLFVLDSEEGFSNWQLAAKAANYNDTKAYFTALQNDARFDSVRRKLGIDDMLNVLYWHKSDDYLKWNEFMAVRVATYLNEAVYAPIKKYFPKVKMSNYGNYYYHKDFPVPDINGHPIYQYGNGSHVGTHQSFDLYGWLGNIRQLRLDGMQLYEATPFNAFRYAVNKIRAIKLTSEIPIYPWVSYKEFDESLLRHSDLYQELIFHIGLIGVDGFLYWNPTTHVPVPATAASANLLSGCLKQLDELVGFDDRKTLVDRLVGWGDDYVLTEMLANNHSVWRFTPKLEDNSQIEDVLVHEFPATFRIGSKTVKIPNGTVFRPRNQLSRQGYWVVEQPQ